MMSRSKKHNNRGFSLIELIVIIAIIAVAAGGLTLSVSLIIGSEAKKAVQKVEASLNDVKTGAMSRYSETLTIRYCEKDVDAGRDTEGFYLIETINTIKKGGTGEDPVVKRKMGVEQRKLCDSRVTMKLACKDASGVVFETALEPDGTNSFVIEYDRATGLYKPVGIGSYGSISSSEEDGTFTYYGMPVSLEFASGMRTYKIEFIEETGKHVRAE